MMRSLKLQGRPWSFSDIPSSYGQKKGERLDGEMHSIHLFSDSYTRQVEALTHKSPFQRLIQSTHNSLFC